MVKVESVDEGHRGEWASGREGEEQMQRHGETEKRGGKPVIASHLLCEAISVPVKAA